MSTRVKLVIIRTSVGNSVSRPSMMTIPTEPLNRSPSCLAPSTLRSSVGSALPNAASRALPIGAAGAMLVARGGCATVAGEAEPLVARGGSRTVAGAAGPLAAAVPRPA